MRHRKSPHVSEFSSSCSVAWTKKRECCRWKTARNDFFDPQSQRKKNIWSRESCCGGDTEGSHGHAEHVRQSDGVLNEGGTHCRSGIASAATARAVPSSRRPLQGEGVRRRDDADATTSRVMTSALAAASPFSLTADDVATRPRRRCDAPTELTC